MPARLFPRLCRRFRGGRLGIPGVDAGVEVDAEETGERVIGFGNRPRSRSVTTLITCCDSLPWSSSSIEPICLEHLVLTDFQTAAFSLSIRMVTS